MPLRDHFRPPVDELLPGEVLHAAWATQLAAMLNRVWLPEEFIAFAHVHSGPHVEIDMPTFQQSFDRRHGPTNGSLATMPTSYAPPEPIASLDLEIPDTFEVKIIHQNRGRRLVAAIEIVSPANKDRPTARAAFLAKCASYLAQGVSVLVLDVVTILQTDLHQGLADLLHWDNQALPEADPLYAALYRPVTREERLCVDVWLQSCVVGERLPSMPLRLVGDQFVPIDFEAAYEEVCRNHRLSE